MRADIQVGETFPDYQLADHAGKRRRLSELQGANAMVLHLSRGGYDPKEHRFLRHLEAYRPTTSSTRTSSATPLEHSGRFSPTRRGRSSATSTSRSSPILTTR
jgi:hypothetical protein